MSNNLLSSVEHFLSATNPETFNNNTTTNSTYQQQIDDLSMNLHLNHIAKFLTDTKQFSMIDNISHAPSSPKTPSPTNKSPRKMGYKSPRNVKNSLPMDMWNMNRSPPKHTHPYIRLNELFNPNYGKAATSPVKRKTISNSSTITSSERRKNHKLPDRQSVTLRLSYTDKVERQNESIIRKFVSILKSSRSVYGKDPETLRDLFQAIDIDCSGTIDIDEFQKVINRLGFGLSEKDITLLADAIDDNQDGEIQYNELCTAIYRIMRQDARRHLDGAKHHASTGSRNVKKDNIIYDQTTNTMNNNNINQFVNILLNRKKSLTQTMEKIRRSFVERDADKIGVIKSQDFVQILINLGIGTNGRESDIAKIALGIENRSNNGNDFNEDLDETKDGNADDDSKDGIYYHEFLDNVLQKLRKHIKKETSSSSLPRSKKLFSPNNEYFQKIILSIKNIINNSNTLSIEMKSKINEFLDPKIDEPRISQEEFFVILQDIGITLSSSALLVLHSRLRLEERSLLGGSLDHRAEDARVAKMHAINEAKIVSKFKVLHKSHVQQNYAWKVEKMKMRRIEQFRLRNMNNIIERLEDGNAIERRFESAIDKIRTSLRLTNDDNTIDIMKVFTLFDKDGNGDISRDEFKESIGLLGCELTTNEIDACFDMLDPDNSGGISLNEFRYAWFNHGKLTRSIQKDNGDESSVEYQKLLKKREIHELNKLEKMYSDQASLIKCSGAGGTNT